jgi:hypothetical protein
MIMSILYYIGNFLNAFMLTKDLWIT